MGATTREITELAFLDGWREALRGTITAGRPLVVRYEPSRLGHAPREVVGYARFLPGGQLRHATLRGGPTPLACELAVPPESRHMELWFHGLNADGGALWDSRFGENYRFDVVGPHPLPTDELSVRRGARVDADVIAVDDDAAVKTNALALAGASLRTTLRIDASVRHDVDPGSGWIDVRFFDRDAALIHGDTLPLHHAPAPDAAPDAARLPLVLDGLLYQGAVATPGSATPRPDVRMVQYRLYCVLAGEVVTDGVLHRCELRADAVSIAEEDAA